MSRTKNPLAVVIVCVVACATLMSACVRGPAPAVTSSSAPAALLQSAADSGDLPEVVVSAPRPAKPIVLSERGPSVAVN